MKFQFIGDLVTKPSLKALKGEIKKKLNLATFSYLAFTYCNYFYARFEGASVSQYYIYLGITVNLKARINECNARPRLQWKKLCEIVFSKICFWFIVTRIILILHLV